MVDNTNSGVVDQHARGIPSRFELLAQQQARIAAALRRLVTAGRLQREGQLTHDEVFDVHGEIETQLGVAADAIRSIVAEHRIDLEREYQRRLVRRGAADHPRRRTGPAYRVPVKVAARVRAGRARMLELAMFALVLAAGVAVGRSFALAAVAFAAALGAAAWRARVLRDFVTQIAEEATDDAIGQEASLSELRDLPDLDAAGPA